MKTPTTLSIEYVNYSNKHQDDKANFKKKKKFAFWRDTDKYSFYELSINWIITFGTLVVSVLTAIFIPIQISKNKAAEANMISVFNQKYDHYKGELKKEINTIFNYQPEASKITFATAVAEELKTKLQDPKIDGKESSLFYLIRSSFDLSEKFVDNSSTSPDKTQYYTDNSIKMIDHIQSNGIVINQSYYTGGSFINNYKNILETIDSPNYMHPADFIKSNLDPLISFPFAKNIGIILDNKGVNTQLFNFFDSTQKLFVETAQVYLDFSFSTESPLSLLTSPNSSFASLFNRQPFSTFTIILWIFIFASLCAKIYQSRKRRRRPWKYTPINESPNNFKNWKKGIFKKNKNKEW